MRYCEYCDNFTDDDIVFCKGCLGETKRYLVCENCNKLSDNVLVLCKLCFKGLKN